MSTIEEMIFPVKLNEEVEQAFLDYSVSVITDRALPDVRDGLKPVHRRIIYGMHLLKLANNKPHRKSAQVVGEVLAKLHPHGDSSVYEAMVRLSQDFSLNLPLVDGHGNFGNIDGDPAAAYRYTEARLSPIGEQMLLDIDKDTVDWKPNFSEDILEPEVLPARFPHLLVNGTTGIAVGMACSFVPHNLKGVLAAIEAYIDNPDISTEELLSISGGPDFPTGGKVINKDELLEGYETGRGRVRIRARYKIEEKNKKQFLVFYELPYMTKKAKIAEDIAKLVENKEIEGITDIRDESAKDIRLVIEIAKGYAPENVAEVLFARTQLENTYSINNTCLVDGTPKTLSFKELIQHYVEFQREVVTRRTEHDLKKVLNRINIIEGLIIALANIDEVIAIIRNSSNSQDAREALINKYQLNTEQAKSILSMRLSSLTRLEVQDLNNEKADLEKKQVNFERILTDREALDTTMFEELVSHTKDFQSEEKTTLDQIDITKEERERLNKKIENVNISINADSIISFVTDRQFKSKINKEQSIFQIATDTSQNLIIFMSNGRAYRVPVDTLHAGDSLNRLLETDEDARIIHILEDKDKEYVMFLTEQGLIKKTKLAEYENIRRTGIIAIRLNDGDEVVSIAEIDEEPVVVLASDGQTIRFKTDEIRDTARNSMGVKAIKLEEGAKAVDFTVDTEDTEYFVTITKNGISKKTLKEEYPIQGRNGKGVIGLRVNENDEALGILSANDEDQLIVYGKRITKAKVEELPIFKRASAGNILAKDGEVNNIHIV